MLRSRRAPCLVLGLALCLSIAACGSEQEPPQETGLVGHWLSPPRQGQEPGPPGFFNLGADGTVEQFDGHRGFRGAYEVDGDRLILEPLPGMDPVPPMRFEVDGAKLTLTMQTPQGEQTVELTRAGAEAPPSNTGDRYAELVEELLGRLRARLEEESAQRARGEVVTLGEVDLGDGGRALANFQVPWSLGGAGVERHDGYFEFTLVWLEDDWRLLGAMLQDDINPQPAQLLQMSPGGTPKVNETVPFAGSVWRAWQDVVQK